MKIKWVTTSARTQSGHFTAHCVDSDKNDNLGAITAGNGRVAWWTAGGSSGPADSVGHAKLAVETMIKIENREKKE